ncbi:MAG TPA: tetratricopeptide repeat protein [Sediminispirochaeta sp.]|nr:tetratricopeptide repeat protein [Sediminispirochaeta sp.]
MKRMGTIGLLAFVLLFTHFPTLWSREGLQGGALWLEMERGIRAYEEGRLGEALRIFRTVVEADSSYANAHMWIGHVFALEGEFDSALRKYEDALREGRNFFPDALRIDTYYSLADIYQRLREPERAKEYLQKVLSEGREEELPPSRRRAITDMFIRQGPDKVLELYRLRDKAVRGAYEGFAFLELNEGNFQSSTEHLVLSTLISFSLIIEHLRSNDPEYRFVQREMNPGVEEFFTDNTALLLRKVRKDDKVRSYIKSAGLYRQLFFIGVGLQQTDRPEAARKIWRLITDDREAGIWYDAALTQLTEPDRPRAMAMLRHW